MTIGRSARSLGAAAFVLLAACSDGGNDSTAPERTSTTSSTASTVVFRGDGDSAFCRLLAESEDRPVQDPFEAGLEPREVELRFRALQLRFTELAEVAPPELEGDVEDLVDGLEDLGSELEAADYDFGAMAQAGADINAFDDDAFLDTAARVDAYRQQVCD